MRKSLATLLALIPALALAGDPHQPVLCDKSSLCDGLVSVHEFDEATDAPREDVYNGGNFLIEPDAMDVTGATSCKFAGPWALANCVDLSSSKYLKYRYTGAFGDGRYTIALWVQVSASGTAGQQMVLYGNESKDSSGSPRPAGGAIYLEYATATTYTPKFRTYQVDDTQKVVAWSSTLTTSASAWHLILVEVESNTFTSSDGKIYISVDGGTRVSTALSNFLRPAVGEFDLGRRPYTGDEKYYTGKVDQLMQWGRVLSASDITLYYNGGSGRSFPFNTN